MSVNKQNLPGIILAVVFAALALFAFTRQQQSATSEATAVANAYSAATSQALSDAGQQTAVAQANTQATAQADAQNSEGTAVAQAQMQGTAQVDAQHSEATSIAQANMQATGQAQAESAEGTAVAAAMMQADNAMTAQALAESAQAFAEATRSAADENAQLTATESQNQAATATVAMGQAIVQAGIAQTAVAAAQDSAATASAQQEFAQATSTVIQQQNMAIQQTATAQADDLQATQTAFAQTVGAQPESLTPIVEQISQHPNDTMDFLVANKALTGVGGRIGARMTTKVELIKPEDWMLWESFSGNYGDFVVSADIGWLGDATEAECGFVLREQDEGNLYVVVIDRTGYMNFQRLQTDEWHDDYTYQSSSAIRTNLDGINHVVVVAQKDEFQVFINGQPAGYYVGSVFDEGQIGLMGAKFNDNDHAGCTFNNAWVWDLAAAGPTATPLPPTAVPTEAAYPVPKLSQSFTHSDRSFSVQYPNGWTTREYDDGAVRLSSTSRPAALTYGNAPDEITLFLWASPESDSKGRSLSDLTADIIADKHNWEAPYDDIAFDEPELFQMGDYEAARAIGTTPDFDFEVIVFGKGKGMFVIEAVCGVGNIGRCEPTIYAIAESLEYRGGTPT